MPRIELSLQRMPPRAEEKLEPSDGEGVQMLPTSVPVAVASLRALQHAVYHNTYEPAHAVAQPTTTYYGTALNHNMSLYADWFYHATMPTVNNVAASVQTQYLLQSEPASHAFMRRVAAAFRIPFRFLFPERTANHNHP